MYTISDRRRAYISRFLTDNAGVDDSPYSSLLWAINHAKLALKQDLEEVNHYFETVELDPRPVAWKDGKEDTADWDFLGVKLLKTVLDFGGSPLLSDRAKAHLRSIFINWRQPRTFYNKDNNRIARWPAIHTENHDIMLLTIGLFGEVFAGRDYAEHVAQLIQSLNWRFERGWVEWNSPCYQSHYLNALLLLQQHAPSALLRKKANDLINLQLAERALLSVNGYLGGPFHRGYEEHIVDDRCDNYLPIIWLAFGLAEAQSSKHMLAGMEFAMHDFEPDPLIVALSAAAQMRPCLIYQGMRFDNRLVRYYNTPHISMGSVQACGYGFQTRFFNVMFADSPGKSVRTYLPEKMRRSPWDQRNERGELTQHKNWLISRGALVEEGGVAAEQAGIWRLYCEGKGLCAHIELPGDLHVFQVSDLDLFTNKRAFLASLQAPVWTDGKVTGRTTDGDEICVDTTDMSMLINGSPCARAIDMLHDCDSMISRYGSGRIEINTEEGSLILLGSE